MVQFVLLFIIGTLIFTSCNNDATGPSPSGFRQILVEQRENYHLPVLAGAYISGGNTELFAVGVRKQGSSDSATINDRWHIGSNLKAMSATMIATLVEEGKLAWDTTIAEVFPELQDAIRAEYRNVTLAMLLHHRGGILPLDNIEAITQIPQWVGTIVERRRMFARWLLERVPDIAPGVYQYSNGGYAVVAAIAERVTGLAWETLMQQRLFAPLNMSVMFGWPASGGAEQPWGHTQVGSEYRSFDPDGEFQFPDVLIPAGHCSLSLRDYSRFALAHLHGLRGTSTLLNRSTFQFLHTAVGQYAAGWEETNLGGIQTSWHEGSDGTFDAMIVLQPERNKAVIAVTNCASNDALVAINDVCLRSLQLP